MKFSQFSYHIAGLSLALSINLRADTNTWGELRYTHYQSSRVYHAPTLEAAVRRTLGANEVVKADFKSGKWYAVFRPSETVRSIANAVGYMEEDDLFNASLPPGPIAGGSGDAPPVGSSIERMEPVPLPSPKAAVQPSVSISQPSQPEVVPDVLSALRILFEGEGLLDTGRYSRDQQEQIFSQRFKGHRYSVCGQISDVGKSALDDRKYITVMVATGHYFDIYPSEDFDLLDYHKGHRICFVGAWTHLGTGIVLKHQMDEAFDASASNRASSSIRRERIAAPPDQKAFALRLRQLGASYRDILKLNNDLKLKDVTNEAKVVLDESRRVNGWIGKVQTVADSLGSSWVTVDYEGIEYKLWPKERGFLAGNDPLPIFKNLSKGQTIRFSGLMAGSMRLTMAGAITDPCMKIEPTGIEIVE